MLTVDDARALARESSLIDAVSPEIERVVRASTAYNAATASVAGIEPPFQRIRTIELEYGRRFTWRDEEQRARVAIVGFDMAAQLFGGRYVVGETVMLNGLPYTVIGKIRNKEQDNNYNGPDNNKIFVPFATMRSREGSTRKSRSRSRALAADEVKMRSMRRATVLCIPTG